MMSERIRLDYSNLLSALSEEEVFALQPEVERCHTLLHDKSGPGGDFLGWVDLPGRICPEEVREIKAVAAFVEQDVDAFVVIGIGGSYLGARAVIEALGHTFSHVLPRGDSGAPNIFFAGHHLDGRYHQDLLEYLDGRQFAINVISKSGTTTEPAIAFRKLRRLLEKKVGIERARELIFVTTDAEKGALHSLAQAKGYKTFVIPNDVGGRYSVLTPVGLLPIAAAGVPISELIEGARAAQKWADNPDLRHNPAYFYAAARNLLYRKGKKIEILLICHPALAYFSEWWKQLFGESEGKEGKGIFPAACSLTTDLHSMGQWIQDGERTLFETILQVDTPDGIVRIEEEAENRDGLNYLAGKDMNDVNAQALAGTALAHREGSVPSMALRIPELNAHYLGQLIYFFEIACGLSGYLLEVNPFDQPGVEAYKKNMFALLSKPGFEEQRQALLAQLKEQGSGKVI